MKKGELTALQFPHGLPKLEKEFDEGCLVRFPCRDFGDDSPHPKRTEKMLRTYAQELICYLDHCTSQKNRHSIEFDTNKDLTRVRVRLGKVNQYTVINFNAKVPEDNGSVWWEGDSVYLTKKTSLRLWTNYEAWIDSCRISTYLFDISDEDSIS